MLMYYSHIPSNPLFDIGEAEPIRTRLASRQPYTKKQIQPVTKQIESKSHTYIQVIKRGGDFSTYRIRLKKKSGTYLLKIDSKIDDYSKVFELNKHYFDVNNIVWENSHSTLTITVPKKIKTHSKKDRTEKKKDRRMQKLKRRQLREQLHSAEPDSDLSSDDTNTGPTITIETETVVADADSGSDSGTDSSGSLSEPFETLHTSVRHKPLLEEVEDEEFIKNRKLLQAYSAL